MNINFFPKVSLVNVEYVCRGKTTVAHKGHLDIFDCDLVTRDRKLLSCDRKYRGVPYEPPYRPVRIIPHEY